VLSVASLYGHGFDVAQRGALQDAGFSLRPQPATYAGSQLCHFIDFPTGPVLEVIEVTDRSDYALFVPSGMTPYCPGISLVVSDGSPAGLDEYERRFANYEPYRLWVPYQEGAQPAAPGWRYLNSPARYCRARSSGLRPSTSRSRHRPAQPGTPTVCAVSSACSSTCTPTIWTACHNWPGRRSLTECCASVASPWRPPATKAHPGGSPFGRWSFRPATSTPHGHTPRTLARRTWRTDPHCGSIPTRWHGTCRSQPDTGQSRPRAIRSEDSRRDRRGRTPFADGQANRMRAAPGTRGIRRWTRAHHAPAGGQGLDLRGQVHAAQSQGRAEAELARLSALLGAADRRELATRAARAGL
jgi:hypothetical protein